MSETEEQKKQKIRELLMSPRRKEDHLRDCTCELCKDKGDIGKTQRIVTGIDSTGKLATKEERQEIMDAMNEPCKECGMPKAFCKCKF